MVSSGATIDPRTRVVTAEIPRRHTKKPHEQRGNERAPRISTLKGGAAELKSEDLTGLPMAPARAPHVRKKFRRSSSSRA